MELKNALELRDLARAAESHVADEDAAVWMGRLHERVSDIQPAVTALLAGGDGESALDLVGALSAFWQNIGEIDSGRELTTSVLDAVGAHQRTRGPARAQLALGELAFRQGDQPSALAATSAAREIAEDLADGWIVGRAEINLARIAFRDKDAVRIFEHAGRALERSEDNLRLRSSAIHMLGWAEYTAGNVAAALAYFQENAALHERMGNRIGQAVELANIAGLAMEAGDLDRAASGLRAAFDQPGATSSRYLAPSLIHSVGILAGLRGNHERAVYLTTGADCMYQQFGLIADPGDDLTQRVRDEAVGLIGAQRTREIDATVAGWSLETVVELARTELGEIGAT